MKNRMLPMKLSLLVAGILVGAGALGSVNAVSIGRLQTETETSGGVQSDLLKGTVKYPTADLNGIGTVTTDKMTTGSVAKFNESTINSSLTGKGASSLTDGMQTAPNDYGIVRSDTLGSSTPLIRNADSFTKDKLGDTKSFNNPSGRPVGGPDEAAKHSVKAGEKSAAEKAYDEQTNELAESCKNKESQASATEMLKGDNVKTNVEKEGRIADAACVSASTEAMKACAAGDPAGVKKAWKKTAEVCKKMPPPEVDTPAPVSKAALAGGATLEGPVSPIDQIKDALTGNNQLTANTNGAMNPLQQQLMQQLQGKVQEMMSGGGSGSGSNGTASNCVKDPMLTYNGTTTNPNGKYYSGGFCPSGMVPSDSIDGGNTGDDEDDDTTKDDEDAEEDTDGSKGTCDKVTATKVTTTTTKETVLKVKNVTVKTVTTVETCKNTNQRVTVEATMTYPDGKVETTKTEQVVKAEVVSSTTLVTPTTTK